MKLQELFSSLTGGRLRGEAGLLEREVTAVTADAREALVDAVFVAVKGTKSDGHDYLSAAVEKGVIGIVVASYDKVPRDFRGSVVIVPDSRAALDQLASAFHGHPADSLFCVGVTGTNGKTSTTYMIEHLLNRAGKPTGVIGTVNHHLKATVWPSEMTTPGPVELQGRLRDFLQAGARAAAMEISSHALDQRRADSVSFDVAVFTNLTRDHLDYHPDMEAYFSAKARLFTEVLEVSKKPQRTAIINGDDPWAKKISTGPTITRWTFGTGFQTDFRFQILKMDVRSTSFRLWSPWGHTDFTLPMPGEHNVQNAVAAIATACAAGSRPDDLIGSWSSFSGIPGRLQIVGGINSRAVFVDYAHTPDALGQVLRTLRKARASSEHEFARIWVVFGCGGDRDRGKRPQMAAIATELADEIVVTSDNPRGEDPEAIIQEVLTGADNESQDRIRTESDRAAAIRLALRQATPGDIILIAGKGHEEYQQIGEIRHPFSDVAVAKAMAAEEEIS